MTGSAAARSGGHLLRSLTSAVVLDGRGDVELLRETRGSPVEWGGVYGQLVRLTGPWRLAVGSDDGSRDLPGSRTAGGIVGELFASSHRWGSLSAEQSLAPLHGLPGVTRSLAVRSTATERATIRIESSLSPFLLPVLVEGIRPTEFRVETRADEIRVRNRGFALSLRWSAAPSQLLLNRASWRGGHYAGPVSELGTVHELALEPGAPAEARFSVSGGLERDLDRIGSHAPRFLADPAAAAGAISRADWTWLATTPTVRLPDAPELERGYNLARLALRRLYASPGNGLTGLVAGYPWYSSIWGRDLAWMLPAVVWLGDFDWAARSLDSTFRFQDRAELPMLGGEPGELPMQLSPGPIFLYGTSDTTLYFPDLVLRLLRHSGDTELVAPWGHVVDRIVAWGRRRTAEGTGLLRNGGEAAAIEQATAGLSKVRYGIDAVDTTIWDSADRRDHAIDVQVLWLGALRSTLELSDTLASAIDPAELASLADRLTASIRRVYAWPEESYLYDSVRGDRPVAQIRPNALRAVSAGLLDAPVARAIVERAARDDLTTPWGVRTLSSHDPQYSPEAYHAGQVWPIATAWAADAAFSVGDAARGVDYLRRIAARLVEEGGEVNECYRGDRPEPFDSCFLLGLSFAPFLSAVFEGLWGITVDARAPRIGLRPRFPAGWRSAALERLRVGRGLASIDFAPGRLRVRWDGTTALRADGPTGSVTIAPGTTGELATG